MLGTLARLHPILPTAPAKGFYKANRQRFLETLRSLVHLDNGYLLFKGPIEQPVYDDDNEFLLVGESNFGYLFGVDEPHTWGLIDLQNDRATLLVEESSPERSFWMKVRTLTDFREEFDGDAVAVVKDLPALIGFSEEHKDTFSKKLWVMEGPNPETLAALHVPTPKEVGEQLSPYFSISGKIYAALRQSRRRKSDEEVRLLLHAADINAKVASALLAYLEEGKTELQIAHHFGALAMYFGNYYPAFNVQVAFGSHAVQAFHTPSKLAHAKNGEVAVVDVGLRVNGLSSRLIRTLPVSGNFTEQQRGIYDRIAGIYQRVLAEVKAKTSYAELTKVIEDQLEDLLVEQRVCVGTDKAMLKAETLRKFYEGDFLTFIGFDPTEPMTYDLQKDHATTVEEQTTLFFKLAIRFDPKLTEGDAAVNQERVKELFHVIPAVKLGDLVIVAEGREAPKAPGLPVDAKGVEEAIRHVSQSAK